MTASVEVVDAGKRYWKVAESGVLLRSILPFIGSSKSELWALRHIDFSVDAGETLGVIGRNGSGKTTLLRMLCGVTRPTEGRVHIEGRIAPLIGVGVGFHPEMSGRENVFVNGTLLGLSREEIEANFDAIVDFAEIRSFIDTPVKFYSSGMFVRLGFAIAIHCEPSLLLIDEVLAVGDTGFQMKCIQRMRSLQEEGTTIIVVSHSVSLIRALCPRVVVLHDGQLDYAGESEEGISRYHEILSATPTSAEDAEAARSAQTHVKSDGVTILESHLGGPEGHAHFTERDAPVDFVVRVRFDRPIADPVFGMSVFAEDGMVVYGQHSPIGLEHRTFRAGEEAEVQFRFLPKLRGGTHRITSAVVSRDSLTSLAEDNEGLLFFVEPIRNVYGAADLEGTVSLDGVPLVDERTFQLRGPKQRDADLGSDAT